MYGHTGGVGKALSNSKGHDSSAKSPDSSSSSSIGSSAVPTRKPLSNGSNEAHVSSSPGRDASGVRAATHAGGALIAKDKSTIVLEERANRIDIQELESSPLTVPLLTPALKHDDGASGVTLLWTIAHGKVVALPPKGGEGGKQKEEGASQERPVWLNSARCYIVHYQFCPGVDRSQVRHVIYAWHGRLSSRADRASCTMCMNEVSTLTGGGGHEDRQVIAEGKETKHFVIACGRLLLLTPSMPSPPANTYRMWAIVDMGAGAASSSTTTTSSASGGGASKTTTAPVGKAVEIVPSAAALYSGGCVIVLDPRAMSLSKPPPLPSGQKMGYVWRGGAAREGALELALLAAQRLLAVDAATVGNVVHVLQEGTVSAALTALYNLFGVSPTASGVCGMTHSYV